jgi:hypothetical protein
VKSFTSVLVKRFTNPQAIEPRDAYLGRHPTAWPM